MSAWLFLSQILVAGVVAISVASVAIYRLGLAVQRGLDQIASRTNEPFVTASFEASPVDRDHLDLVVENSGFAPAFDIRVVVMPEIPTVADFEDRPADWRNVSLLRPGQMIAGYACRADQVVDREFLIEISWKNGTKAAERIALEYKVDMRRYRHQRPFTAAPVRDEMLSEIRNLRRDWRPVARGDRALKVELSSKALQSLIEREGAPKEGRRGERLKPSREDGQRQRWEDEAERG